MMELVEYEFYLSTYGGNTVSKEEFPPYARDAAAILNRWKRDCKVTPISEDGEQMAMCAMVETMHFFAVSRSGLYTSTSIGSVSSSRAQSSVPDLSSTSENQELYRCASVYLNFYFG